MTRPAATRTQRRGVARALGGDRGAPRGTQIADHADEPAERMAWYRYLLWPTIAAAVGLAGMLAGGVPTWRAVLIAVAAGLALWALVASLVVEQPEWPYDIPLEPHRATSVWEVPGLTGATESEVSFQQYLRPRLWALTQELLRRRGIDPSSERAVAMVGRREYDLLSGADTDPKRAMSSVSVLCHTVARLATEAGPGSEPVIRNPALAGLAGTTRHRRRRGAHTALEGQHR